MKLRWYNRLLLILSALILLALAALLGMLSLGYGRAAFDSAVDVMLYWTINRALLAVGAVLLLALGLRLLSLRSRKPSQPSAVFMRSTDAGTIRITIAALEAMVQRTSRGIAQVREVKVRVYTQEQNLRIRLDAMLAPDAAAKDVCEALQSAVKSDIEDHTGIPVAEVEVVVQAPPAAQQMQRVE